MLLQVYQLKSGAPRQNRTVIAALQVRRNTIILEELFVYQLKSGANNRNQTYLLHHYDVHSSACYIGLIFSYYN